MRSNIRLLALTVALAVAVIVVAIVLAVSGNSSSAKDVSLPNVGPDELASAHLTVEPADQSTAITRDQAVSIATDGDGSKKTLDVSLVKASGGGHFTEAQLVWAVSLDPTTVAIHPITGDISPEGSPLNLQQKARFDVVFVDAVTGDVVFQWIVTEPAS